METAEDWPGATDPDDAVPVGSGIIVFRKGNEYMVTALRVVV